MQLEIDALKEAAAWPGADRRTPVVLASQLNAAELYQEGGMGLTSAPATESIMGAISRAKAGVGSAVNDSTRLVGGTLGVAVIGSVYASIYGSRLTATMPAAVPGSVAAIAHQSVGAAYVAASKIAALGHPALGLALHHASTNAFLRGLTIRACPAGYGQAVCGVSKVIGHCRCGGARRRVTAARCSVLPAAAGWAAGPQPAVASPRRWRYRPSCSSAAR